MKISKKSQQSLSIQEHNDTAQESTYMGYESNVKEGLILYTEKTLSELPEYPQNQHFPSAPVRL